MGLYLNMEKPEGCADCPFCTEHGPTYIGKSDSDGNLLYKYIYRCYVVPKEMRDSDINNITNHWLDNTSPDWCPLLKTAPDSEERIQETNNAFDNLQRAMSQAIRFLKMAKQEVIVLKNSNEEASK